MKEISFETYTLMEPHGLPPLLSRVSAATPSAAVMAAWVTLRSWVLARPPETWGSPPYHIDYVRERVGTPGDVIGVFRVDLFNKEVLWAAFASEYLLDNLVHWPPL